MRRRRYRLYHARPRTRRRMRRVQQLARRWGGRRRSSRWRGYTFGIRKRARRHPIHNRRWSWSGRRGSVDILRRGHLMATNPRHRRRRHRRSTWAVRLNPGVAGALRSYASPVLNLPTELKRTFSGKGLLVNSAFAIAGAAGSLAGGTMLQGLTLNVMGTSAAALLASDIGKRAFGAGHVLLVGGLAAKLLPVKGDQKTAILAGTGAATVMEIVFPGMMANYLRMIPGVAMLLPAPAAMAPVSGLAAYLAGYRPGGFLPLGGYVSAPGYQGVGRVDRLAGLRGLRGLGSGMPGEGTTYAMGSKMPSFLDAYGADETTQASNAAAALN